MKKREKVEKEYKEVKGIVSGISKSPIGDIDIEIGKGGLPDLSGKWESKVIKMDLELPTFSKKGTINESETCKECKEEITEDVNWNLEDIHINVNRLLVNPVLIPLVKSIIYTQEYFLTEYEKLEKWINENRENINSVRQLANRGLSEVGNAVNIINSVSDRVNSNNSNIQNTINRIGSNITLLLNSVDELSSRISILENTFTEMNENNNSEEEIIE